MNREYSDEIRRARIAETLNFGVDMSIDEMRKRAEEVHGKGTMRLTVSCYDSLSGNTGRDPFELPACFLILKRLLNL